MRFPERERCVYARNPLSEVICQIDFPALLEIQQTLPVSFQKALAPDFPHFDKRIAVSVALDRSSIDTGAMSPQVEQSHFYEFATADRCWIITLRKDAVSISTSAYTRWEHLRYHIEKALAALLQSYAIGFFVRTGLRYSNVIDRSALGIADAPWRTLIRPSLLGIIDEAEASEEPAEFRGVHLIAVESGQVNIRHGLIGSPEERQFLIDLDFFSDLQVDADIVNALTNFDKQHTEAGCAFRWSIQEELHVHLCPGPI